MRTLAIWLLLAVSSAYGRLCEDGSVAWEGVADTAIDAPAEGTWEGSRDECRDECAEHDECVAFSIDLDEDECSWYSAVTPHADHVLAEGREYHYLQCFEEPEEETIGAKEWLTNHPEYAAMIGMGVVILLLIVTNIVAVIVLSRSNRGSLQPI